MGAPPVRPGGERPPKPGADSEEAAPPNKLLFVSDIPDVSAKEMLQSLFGQYNGLSSIRITPRGALIDFDNDLNSSIAMQGLQDFKYDATRSLKIVFAKK